MNGSASTEDPIPGGVASSSRLPHLQQPIVFQARLQLYLRALLLHRLDQDAAGQ